MKNHPFLSISSKLGAVIIAVITTILCLSPAANAEAKKLRVICVSSLEENQKVVLASHDSEGKWQKHQNLELRNSLVSESLPAQAGELHIAVEKDNTLESICHFTYPEASNSGLVFLVANSETKTYDAHFVDPKEAKLKNGSLLIFNFSALNATISLETVEHKVDAGQHLLVQPPVQDNGMHRMQISYTKENGENQTCYDRYVSKNPAARNMVFLLADQSTGIRATSLYLLGEAD